MAHIQDENALVEHIGRHFLPSREQKIRLGIGDDAALWKQKPGFAAMGGTPRCFLLNLALPADATGKWLKSFLGGLRRAARSLDCVLAGGDTTRSKRILINVTVIGEIREGQEVLRSEARAGDLVYVSGTLGEAEHGLQLLRKRRGKVNPKNVAMQKHLYPQPRVALGRWLAGRKL